MKTCRPFSGLKTLIVGDVNTGKTAYTRLLLMECRGGQTILILDMAPEAVRGIGGKMSVPAAPDIHYATTQILPPRLTGKDASDSLRIASENAARIERDLLAKAEQTSADVLIINDVSLYLQAGSLDRLIRAIERFSTVIMNGYMGQSFPEGPLTRRERKQMTRLMERCDQVIGAEGLNENSLTQFTQT